MAIIIDRFKKRHRIYVFTSYCFLIFTLLFIVLFANEKQINQQKYNKIFNSSMENAVSLIDECLKSDFDYETKYLEITAEMNVCCQMAYLVKMSADRQRLLNELYYACIKLPSQVKLYMSDIHDALNQIVISEDDGSENEDKGYKMLGGIIDKFDYLDYGGENY